MKVLAIDTSNLVMGISVLDEGKVHGEYITNLKRIIRYESCQQLKKCLKRQA